MAQVHFQKVSRETSDPFFFPTGQEYVVRIGKFHNREFPVVEWVLLHNKGQVEAPGIVLLCQDKPKAIPHPKSMCHHTYLNNYRDGECYDILIFPTCLVANAKVRWVFENEDILSKA